MFFLFKHMGIETGYSKSSMFKKRTIVVIIGVPVVIAFIWFGTPWFTIFGAIWGVMAAYEFYGIVKHSKGLSPLTFFGLTWVALLIVSPDDHIPSSLQSSYLSAPFLLVAATLLPLIILLFRPGKENAFADWAWTVASILYIGFLLRYFIALRAMVDGRDWVFLAMLCTFASDISAYLGGRSLGRHKLAPYISPNKTWEGAVSGVLGSMIIALIMVGIFQVPEFKGVAISYWQAVVLGIAISVIGQLGDLVKSLFKRNMTVKDSSHLIPGHGGFLDRMDSMAFAAVLVYFSYYFWSLFK